ncbi:hypothetical protein VTJ83DRAFT_6075 [Remersonia thermophila]|uniref:Glutathione S-transferase UstS-like C-terminal domain-containing protein n=1 Tax=Remersonia thermophila TaxID=72144 RepID=A0ABR4D8N4_9PEZI
MSEPAITFYDIILDPKAYPGAPNPWKTRYALNFAGVPYRTQWVPFLQVGPTRNALKVPAVRKHFHDGSDYPTLPIIKDPLSGEDVLVGDSFDIAVHLQRTYLSKNPDGPQLFPASAGDAVGSVALTRAWNLFIDDLFVTGAILGGYWMSFDPETAEADKAEFIRRAPGKTSWEDFQVPIGSEMRGSLLKTFETALDTKVAPCYPDGQGPFMGGRTTPMYADFILGGWLQFMRSTLPEWEQLRNQWSGGKWGRLFDALEEWTKVDGREGVVPTRR